LTIICKLDYLSKNIFKYLFTLVYRVTFCFLIILTVNLKAGAEVPYPDDTGQKVLDLSNKFDSNYLHKLDTDLGQYETEIRIVFIDSKNSINLGLYAPKLFHHWNMSEDSILAVIDPYLNKTGYGLGKNVMEKLKARNKVEFNDPNKNPENGNIIDYQNLPLAIRDKFAPENTVTVPKNNQNNNGSTGLKNNNQGSNSNQASNDRKPPRPFSPWVLRIFIMIILLIILGIGGGYLYNRKQKLKRQLELKTTYSFDGEILSEQLADITEKISGDIEKMSKYRGQTKKELISHIEKLNNNLEKADLFSEKLANSLEEIELDNLYYISEILDEGKMLVENLENIHKESVGFRKEYKAILEKNSMHMSDIRVNIENCRNLLEDMRTLYILNLEFSEKKINDCEKLLSDAQDLIHRNDPLEYRSVLQNIHETIKELKRDFEIIPHLYKQLQESIPQSINSSLEESIIESAKKNTIRDEINNLKNKALDNLAKGNLEKSELLISQIFNKLNEVKGEEVRSEM
jgi:hypothetical protein